MKSGKVIKNIQNSVAARDFAPMPAKARKRLVNNVLAACKDISLLTRAAYSFLYLCNGFIAHYNQLGFMDYYQHNSLRDDIIQNYPANLHNNFHPGDDMYEYYMERRAIYTEILDQLKAGR